MTEREVLAAFAVAIISAALVAVGGIFIGMRGRVFEAIRQGDHFYLDDTRYRCNPEVER